MHYRFLPNRVPAKNGGQYTHGAGKLKLLMGVHHFFWFVWEGVVVELAGSVSTEGSWNADSCL